MLLRASLCSTSVIILLLRVVFPTGMIGYSAYCPSKFAVRGLAECLRNEVGGTGQPYLESIHRAAVELTVLQ